MRKFLLVTCLLVALLMMPSQAQAFYLIDTGHYGTFEMGGTFQGVWSLFSFGGRITGIETWVEDFESGGCDNENGCPFRLGISIYQGFSDEHYLQVLEDYANGSGNETEVYNAAPRPGGDPIFSAIFDTTHPGSWQGVTNLDLTLLDGLYWVGVRNHTEGGGVFTMGYGQAEKYVAEYYGSEMQSCGDTLFHYSCAGIGSFRISAIPEPATMVLFGAGILGMVARRKKKIRGIQRLTIPLS